MVDVSQILVGCEVHLGRCELTAAEYNELQVGDVILLDQNPGEPLEMTVGKVSFGKVVPGLEGIRKAVVIKHE